MEELELYPLHCSYPDHPPRKNSVLYNHTHKHLCKELDIPCYVCGATHTSGTITETHHFFCEWVAMNAFDWIKFGEDCVKFKVTNPQTGIYFGELFDWMQVQANPELFVDSEFNMVVLCPIHHRDAKKGIHHASYPEWNLQKFAKDGFVFLLRNDL
jgi:hypothetical protein